MPSYNGHDRHCECERFCKSTERQYATVVKLNDKLSRVARAAEKHIHDNKIEPCFICITLRELHEPQKDI